MSESYPQPSTSSRWIRRGWRAVDYVLRHEWAGMLALGLVVAGAWGFLELAGEVSEGDTRAWDAWILRSMRTGPGLDHLVGPEWLERAVLELTSLGGLYFATLLTTLVVLGLALGGRWARAGVVAAAMIGGAIWITLLKGFYARVRPTEVVHLMQETTESFPSGHASIASAMYLTLGLLLAQLARHRRFKAFYLITALLLTFLVGLTRLAIGVHYPTDVLGGWLLGGAWAVAIWLIAHIFERHLNRADEASQRATQRITGEGVKGGVRGGEGG